MVAEGLPQFAVFDDLRDRDAVLAMLSQTDGSFAFWSQTQQGEKTMSGKLTQILLEHSRRQDEAGQG